MEWYQLVETGEVTHYCKGVEKKEEVVERYKEGIQGNIKPKGTNNELTLWFNPATLEEGESEEAGNYRCNACGLYSPKDVEFVKMGDV